MSKPFRNKHSTRFAKSEPPQLTLREAPATKLRKSKGAVVSLFAIIIGRVIRFSPVGTAANNRILEWRMAATPPPASGDVLFVAIDARSLRDVGTWPWSDIYGTDLASDTLPTSPEPRTLTLESGRGTKNIEYLATRSVFHELGNRPGDTIARPITPLTIRDVTDQKRRDREIEFLSTHDARIGALRRETFLDRLSQRMQAHAPTTVFVLNLHRIKAVNRTLGRDVGDQVLIEVVSRLKSFGRGLSAVARLDGDSFSVFIDHSSRKIGCSQTDPRPKRRHLQAI